MHLRVSLLLALVAGCYEDSGPPRVPALRQALASCNTPANCPQVGPSLTVSCTANQCVPSPGAISCTGDMSDERCDDGITCTTDTCDGLGVCQHAWTGSTTAGCCDTDDDCPLNACQLSASCHLGTHSCAAVRKSDPGCCNGASDCGAEGSPTCVANTCTCGFGRKLCPGRGCIPLAECCVAADCDAVHSTGRACSGGTCTYTGCNGTRADCNTSAPNTDGCETDTATSTAHCGSCNRPCATTQTASLVCAVGKCESSCNPGFRNCSKPNAPAADNGCESATSTDINNCGGCFVACPPASNACQAPTCAASACGYVSTGAPRCCNPQSLFADCAPGVCQDVGCSANTCVYMPKAGMSGCCAVPADCPEPPNPCVMNTCVNNTCGTMAIPGCELDMTVLPDLAEPIDLAEPPDLGVPDLREPDLPALKPDFGRLSVTGGGGGCSFALTR